MWTIDCRKAGLIREGVAEVWPYNVAWTRVVTLKMKRG